MRTQLPRPAPAAAPPCRAPPAAPPCGTRTATRRAAPRWRASLHARAAARCAAGSAAAEAAVEQPAAQQPDTLTLAVMGDLHMDPRNMGSFISARSQLVAALSDGEGRPLPAARVVQLGDLGAYATQPGSVACFDHAAGFLRGFAPLPFSVVLGNHDLEGFEDFPTDAANLAGWQAALGSHHHWAVPAGPWLLIGLSTTRFRDAVGSSHEIYVDDEQLAWFAETLAANRHTPTAVFSHAPPQGCGLRVLTNVHVKNRCAWLNHGRANAGAFGALQATNPQLKLWFSGHFHLSHDYSDSVSERGECLYVQTGVIGDDVTKDGRSHSRLLRADAFGYRLFTVDHAAGGAVRLDVERRFSEPRAEIVPSRAITKPPPAAPAPGALPPPPTVFPVGRGCELRLTDGMLVQYDVLTGSAVGVVATKLNGRAVEMVGANGDPAAGSAVVAVELRDEETGDVERLERAPTGAFFRVFQKNKYQRYMREKAAAARAGEAGEQQGAGI